MLPSADVTVILCTRDRPDLLGEALESIRRASPSSVEIMVVDSGSKTGQTRDIALGADAVYIRSDVPGLSIARNIGLAASSRRFVVYTDDDCRPVAGWTEPLLAAFADPAVGAVTGRMLDRTLVGHEPHYSRKWRLTSPEQGIDGGHGALMAFDRELLVTLGGFDEVLGAGRRFAGAEDLDMFCRVLLAGRHIVHTPLSVVVHAHTRADKAFTRLYYGYGLGLGAMVSKWMRINPPLGWKLLAVISRRSVVRAARVRPFSPPFRMIAAQYGGLLRALFTSLPLPIKGDRFVDVNPPRPTLLPIDDSGEVTHGR